MGKALSHLPSSSSEPIVSWSYSTTTSFCISATSTGKWKFSFQVALLPAGWTLVCLLCVDLSHSLQHGTNERMRII